ncbi:hypothetical protein VTO58DRAFT_101678 [Aureobasidium pullulans]
MQSYSWCSTKNHNSYSTKGGKARKIAQQASLFSDATLHSCRHDRSGDHVLLAYLGHVSLTFTKFPTRYHYA